mmetsp:Transcript_1073/g.2463  ORF Transcript_1073/g.2463 Transcript_1073/m.2463 type:complete len:180 (+) Transcript_1073:127-666(+)
MAAASSNGGSHSPPPPTINIAAADSAHQPEECPSPTVEMQRCLSTGFAPSKDYVVVVEGRRIPTAGLAKLSGNVEEALSNMAENGFDVECVKRADARLLGVDLFFHPHLQLVEVSKVHNEGCIARWNQFHPDAQVGRGSFILQANGVDFRPKTPQEVATAFAPHLRVTLRVSVPPSSTR